jgi:hypothetical protein
VTCGVTFTFGGLRITTDGEVLNTDYKFAILSLEECLSTTQLCNRQREDVTMDEVERTAI